jgi:group I intron endonuclease
MNNMIIYKVKNKISGKVYIGQTIHTLETRKNTHLKMVEVGKSKFYKALKSYGVDNFDWVVIDTATTKDELNQKEKQYIQEYNSIEEGYNMVEGGTGGYNKYAVIANKKKLGKKLKDIVSPEMYEQSIAGRKRGFKNGLSNYTFDKIDKEKQREIARKGAYKLVEMGYTHSEETKKKISEAQKGITFEDRYGVDGAEVQRQIISQKTKEAMKKVDWDSLMEKALKGRKVYWDNKHSTDKDKILELKAKGYKIKHICAELDISTPTYYKRVRELENEGKI